MAKVAVYTMDGAENGQYKNMLLDIDYREAAQTQARQGWNMGTREKTEDIVVEKE